MNVTWLSANAPVISTIIAAISLLVAGWAAWRSREFNDRLLSIEEARERDRIAKRASAELRAQISPLSAGQAEITIENRGSAPARNIKVFIDGKPPSKDGRVFRGPGDVIDVLAQQAHLTYGTATSMGDPLDFKLRMDWDDEAGGGDWLSEGQENAKSLPIRLDNPEPVSPSLRAN